MSFKSEKDIAKVAVSHFRQQEWRVWQEVRIHTSIHDIIAVKDSKIAVIECKKSLSLTVIGQAWNCPFANYKYIAIPGRHTRINRISQIFGERVCKEFNIGIISIVSGGYINKTSRECVEKNNKDVLTLLEKIPQDFCEAGSARGGYFTPYKATMKNIKEIIQKNPGCTIGKILFELGDKHHYAQNNSARSNIPKALIEFESWCRCDKSEKLPRFYVK